MRNTYVTIHNPETGESRTFAPDEDLPDWAQDGLTNPDVYDVPADDDLIGGGEDPLMKRTHDDLVKASDLWEATGVSKSNTKAELAAAIRAAGYEGDGSDLLDGE